MASVSEANYVSFKQGNVKHFLKCFLEEELALFVFFFVFIPLLFHIIFHFKKVIRLLLLLQKLRYILLIAKILVD